MGDKTSIEWTATRHADGTVTPGATWNPIRARNLETGGVGHYCEKVSPGCANCYAERMQPRFKNDIRYNAADLDKVELFLDEETLTQPLRWTRPRMIFPCSMTDLFGSWVKDEWLDRIFAVMALSPQHTFQVLTKRPERMKEYFATMQNVEMSDYLPGSPFAPAVSRVMWQVVRTTPAKQIKAALKAGHLVEMEPDVVWVAKWPLPNVWLGVSAEDQKTANERIPLLLQTPAAVRWISAEPLQGPIEIWRSLPNAYICSNAGCRFQSDDIHGTACVTCHGTRDTDDGECAVCDTGTMAPYCPKCGPEQFSDNDGFYRLDEFKAQYRPLPGIDWVVAGGESGSNSRAMHPEWARSLRDQCTEAGIAFFFKQWGQHRPALDGALVLSVVHPDGRHGAGLTGAKYPHEEPEEVAFMEWCRNKKDAGRELDGRTWDEYPEV